MGKGMDNRTLEHKSSGEEKVNRKMSAGWFQDKIMINII